MGYPYFILILEPPLTLEPLFAIQRGYPKYSFDIASFSCRCTTEAAILSDRTLR